MRKLKEKMAWTLTLYCPPAPLTAAWTYGLLAVISYDLRPSMLGLTATRLRHFLPI